MYYNEGVEILKVRNYVRPESLEEVYELNQKKSSCILGGMIWLKMGNRKYRSS